VAVPDRPRGSDTGEFAHPSVIFVLGPGGVISRYLYGIDYPPRDLKLAMLEASQGRVGSTFDHVLMRCYAYDPATRRYGLFIQGFFRVGGAVIFAAVLALLLVLWRRGRRKRAA
jgi:protein SCO1/2